MSFKKIGIFWNPKKGNGLSVARELLAILGKYPVQITTDNTLAHALGKPALSNGGFDSCDLLVVIGGDGTILSALDYSMPNAIPILGINLGRMGFLSEVEPENLQQDITNVMEGRYRVDSRMTMTVQGQDMEQYFALNEIVITRSEAALRILSVEIEVNGMPVDRISGDGLIIATATGSTAYSLSAGGPIIRPGLECNVITPICAHTLKARPVVVSANDEITIRLMDNTIGAHAVLDGRKVVEILPGKKGITIIRSELKAKFIRLHERNYFTLLQDKLSEWTH